MAALALTTSTHLLLPIIGGLFVMETISVILQIVVFKRFNGRRLFRMAPLHHHFELSGWPETTVIVRLWIMSGLHRGWPRPVLRRRYRVGDHRLMREPAALDRLSPPISALVVGFGVANRRCGRFVRRGHAVVATDDRPNPDVVDAALGLGIELVTQSSDLATLVEHADLIVPTPGLPESHPIFSLADARDRPVVSELDLAAVWDQRPVVAVTGTNGKTTTVELAVAALVADGRVAVSAGNTDIPLVAAIDDPSTEVFVVEASSFRLARSFRFRPLVATWLNFAPDHLDVHCDLESYEAAKAVIFSLVGVEGTVVANALTRW